LVSLSKTIPSTFCCAKVGEENPKNNRINNIRINVFTTIKLHINAL